MDSVGAKVLVLFLIGVLKLSAGLAPLVLTGYLTKKRKVKCLHTFIGVILCFGGGILLATVFIHIIKEVRESVNSAVQMGVFNDPDLDYPFAELLICLGFLLILLVEVIVHKVFDGHGHSHEMPSSSLKETNRESRDVDEEVGRDNKAYQDDDLKRNSIHLKLSDGSATLSKQKDHPDSSVNIKTSPFFGLKGRNVYNVTSGSVMSSPDSPDRLSASTGSIPGEAKSSRDKIRADDASNSKSKLILTSVREFLIVFALSTHSLFEGMAIGLEESEPGVWKLFAAVVIHALAIVFCVGTEMISSGTKKRRIICYMFVLALNSPIGVAIGLIVTLHVETASAGHMLAVGILQGIAGGTLLYITFFEVLSRDKLTKYKMTGITGSLVILFGFVIMAGLEGIGGHSHSHMVGESLGAGHAHNVDVSDHHGHNHPHHHPHDHPHTEEQSALSPFNLTGIDFGHDGLHHHNHSHDHDHGHDHGNHEHDHHGHEHIYGVNENATNQEQDHFHHDEHFGMDDHFHGFNDSDHEHELHDEAHVNEEQKINATFSELKPASVHGSTHEGHPLHGNDSHQQLDSGDRHVDFDHHGDHVANHSHDEHGDHKEFHVHSNDDHHDQYDDIDHYDHSDDLNNTVQQEQNHQEHGHFHDHDDDHENHEHDEHDDVHEIFHDDDKDHNHGDALDQNNTVAGLNHTNHHETTEDTDHTHHDHDFEHNHHHDHQDDHEHDHEEEEHHHHDHDHVTVGGLDEPSDNGDRVPRPRSLEANQTT